MCAVHQTDKYRALSQRIDALAKRNRLLSVLVLGLIGIGLVAGADTKSAESQFIQARGIQLVDEAGRVRAELAIDKDGSAGLFVRDEKNRVRASVTHDDSQSALYLWDEAGQIRVGVAQFAHGGGGVALHGPHGKGATALYHKDQGSLTFYDKDGKVTSRVPEAGE